MNSAIILAGGKGKRMKGKISKQYIELMNKPIIAHTIDVFEACEVIDEIILVAGVEDIELCTDIIKKYNYKKIKSIVEGGTERQDSVYCGLKKVNKNCSIVLIHDGARPLVNKDLITKCTEEAIKHGAVTAGVRIKETVKIVSEDGFVVNTPKREDIWVTQTPQAFLLEIIEKSHEHRLKNNISATDDAMLAELRGYPVKMIEAYYENIKITTPEDLISAEIILKRK